MDALKKRIINEGRILEGDVLKVDSFLNHQIDIAFMQQIGAAFKERFKDCEVTKILTVEASGIAVSFATSQFFNNVPVIFAKKGSASNMSPDCYQARLHSYTRDTDFSVSVANQYLNSKDKVLILDDFLANGEALRALISIVNQAGSELVGCGVVIEKGYQLGGRELRAEGVRIEALARIKSMDKYNGIEFF
ncbi:MAG: xanthine phosphoribosyltransferase [Erysipelotrichaceae bacterium]|nr:xanthine phosphoribosyltransferase [Erysipelotrichaceae bacterium]